MAKTNGFARTVQLWHLVLATVAMVGSALAMATSGYARLAVMENSLGNYQEFTTDNLNDHEALEIHPDAGKRLTDIERNQARIEAKLDLVLSDRR